MTALGKLKIILMSIIISILLVFIHKPFPQSITVFYDNILMHV